MQGIDSRDHLFLPDRQVKPGCSNAIDHAIGNYIVKHRPAVIINIGDHADMESLSSYDVGKASAEGKRYEKDIEASIHAHELMFQPLRDLQAEQRQNSRLAHRLPAQDVPVYTPETHICYGNHENRIMRAVDDDPRLGGWMCLEDLQYARFYQHVHPFLKKFIVDGVTYTHYSWKKIPHKAIGGEMIARTILKHERTSISVGHTPEFAYHEAWRGDGKKIQCLVAGAAFDHHEPYAGERNKNYWRGIVHKYNVKDGVYDFEKISIERLLKGYL